MSLFKRGKTWWISFTTPSGKRIRCSAATEDKNKAQEFHDKLKAESWRIAKVGDQPKYTWDEAAYKWLVETQHKATHKQDMQQIAWIQQFFRGRLLSEIKREVIAEVGEIKRKETSPTTANRYLAIIRAILRRAAQDWEWIEKAPFIRLYKEPKRRIRWISPQQVAVLLNELPEHLVNLVKFSLSTGLRKRNVTELEWSQVDLLRNVAWIHADQAKGRKSIHVSLNATAIEVLRKQMGKHPAKVFTYQGRPITQTNTRAWRKALIRAGIEDFRWHDLRHTWASWLTQGGVPLNVIQEMGAWESTEMVKRYAHLAPEQFKKHAEVVDGLLIDTNLTQLENQQVRLIT